MFTAPGALREPIPCYEHLQQLPTGVGSNARHPDGTAVEYVHHCPDADGRGPG